MHSLPKSNAQPGRVGHGSLGAGRGASQHYAGAATGTAGKEPPRQDIKSDTLEVVGR